MSLRSAEYKLLQAACQSTATRHPELQRGQDESSDEGAESIEKEICGFLGGIWKDRESVADSAEESLQPLMLLYDVALLQVCDMSYFGLKNADHRRRLIWPNLALPSRPPPNGVFYVLTSNLAQSMQAFRLLILHGFESQARATFRGIVEIADLMIMVLASEATYREYIKSFEDPKTSYRHWKNNLSPGVIRASLSKLEVNSPINIPIDTTPNDIRSETYSWLSKFIHVHFVAHVGGAHPPKLDGTFGRLAMLGSVGEMSKATLAHSLIYLWISLLRLENLLWEKHGWGHFRGERSRKWFHYRCRALDELFLSYLPTFWEKNPPVGL
jgi:hypothetical protein